MAGEVTLDPADCAQTIVDVASDRLASDIVMLDLRGVSDFTDYFVIMSAESARQIEGLVEFLEVAVKQKGGRLHHREGPAEAGWVLLDFGDVIVHVMRPEEREYYDIEAKALIWLTAWVRAFTAESLALLSIRSISTSPSPDLGVA